MSLLTARLTTFAAIVTIATAQVVVAPGVCCLLRSSLTGGACCRHVAASEAPRSCCHRHAPTADAVVNGENGLNGTGECLWCSAGPKIGSQERVTPPAPEFALPIGTIEPVSSSATSAYPPRPFDEPFHRTALAACAWLCVWLK